MGSLVGCDDEWWMMIRCFGDRWLVFRLRFTCYLLPCSLSLCDSANCRVVWGLDRWGWSGSCGWLLILWWFWLEIGVNHVISRDFRLVCWWIVIWLKWWFESGVWGWLVVVSWGYGVWWDWHWLLVSESMMWFRRRRWLCDRRSLGRCETWRSRRGVTEVTERLMMLDVELVVNLYRSSRAFSRNCCVFGIIVRLADWLIDFYLKWCGVWWLGRLFWIGNLNNVRGGCRSR